MERTFPFFRSTHTVHNIFCIVYVYSVAGIWIPNFAWLGIIAEVGPESSRHELCKLYCPPYISQGFTFIIYNFGSVIEGFVGVVMRCHVTVLPKVEEECSRGSAPASYSQPLEIFFWSQFCCRMQHLSVAQCNPAILSQWKSRDFMIQNDQGMQFPTTVAFLLINNKLNSVINLFVFP